MVTVTEILSHPEEIWPLWQMYQASRKTKKLPKDETWRWCFGALNRTSRSFALVIQQLPPELKDAVCVFYLVLRALDTIEDDMSVPKAVKVPALRSFHESIGDRGFKMDCGVKPNDKDLMANYCHVADAYLKLEPPMKKVIKEITQRMGDGMADFIEKEVNTIQDWDLYCHYVAGLVGIGLSNLFAASERESSEYTEMEDLSNHMGLFLQKTNIIRDYLEDIMEEPAPRMFWPKEIWGKYAGELSAFKKPENIDAALQCLNHMIANALGHVEACFDYMIRLRDPAVFSFCAIPQLMAMGTLALCYNNPEVFRGVVKMRRGQTASLIAGLNGMEGMYTAYMEFAVQHGLKGRRRPEQGRGRGAQGEHRQREATGESHTLGCQGTGKVTKSEPKELVTRMAFPRRMSYWQSRTVCFQSSTRRLQP